MHHHVGSLRYAAQNEGAPITHLDTVHCAGQRWPSSAYDGDGKRVKRVDNNGTIHYVGNHYERNVGNGVSATEVITKYYCASFGTKSRLVAFKQGSVLYFVCPDRLGSTFRAVDPVSHYQGDIRYHAFGGTKSGSVPTDKNFTGQTLDASTGLYSYGVRYYDPNLGRFTQPDTIVPDHKNPQALNRYSYALNNPLKYTDPTGHWTDDEGNWYPDDDPGDAGASDEGDGTDAGSYSDASVEDALWGLEVGPYSYEVVNTGGSDDDLNRNLMSAAQALDWADLTITGTALALVFVPESPAQV